MSEKELRKFFEFDESDLSANRAGKLSPKQMKRLEENEKGADQILIGFGVFLIIIALVISYFVTSDIFAKGISNISSRDVTPLILGIGLPWGILGFFAVGSFRIAFSKLDNSLQNVEGKVKFVKVEKTVEERRSDGSHDLRTVQQYELRVGRVNFENVDEDLLNIIDEGDTYAFYYTKQAKQILSAEPIKTGK